MSSRQTLLRLGVSVALVAIARPGLTQTSDPVTARALFDEATAALDKGDWDGACPKFDASFALKPTVSGLLNIAKCHEHAGKLTLAADDYRRAAALNEDTTNQARKKEVSDFTTDALGKLTTRIPKLRIVVKNAPAGLHVTLDGRDIPVTALGIPLPTDPGGHVITASATDRKTESPRVILEERQDAEVAIDLHPLDAPAAVVAKPPPPMASSAPVSPPPPAAEKHGIPAWAWIGGVLGVALGGTAIGFAVDGAGANCGGACTDDKFTQSDVDNLNARRHRDLGLGLALGGLGAVGIATFGIGVASVPSDARSSQAKSGFVVRPWTTGGSSGVGFGGLF